MKKAKINNPWDIIEESVRSAVEFGWNRNAFKHVDPPEITDSQKMFMFDKIAESVCDSLKEKIKFD